MFYKLRSIFTLFLVVLAAACEIDTKVRVNNSNPPHFELSGSGRLSWLRVHSCQKFREGNGEMAHIAWEIVAKDSLNGDFVEDLKSITYGQVPPSYIQEYPQTGQPPPLIEGCNYDVMVITAGANGETKNFKLSNGQVIDTTPAKNYH